MQVVPTSYRLSHSVRKFVVLLAMLFCVFLSPKDVMAQDVNEEQIKAVFLYNLTHFVSWPEKVMESSPTFNIGVYGDELFRTVLTKTVQMETKEGKKIVVSRLSRVTDITDRCRIVFISGDALTDWDALRKKIELLPILTVSDSTEFTSRGGMVGLLRQNKKIQIEVNHSVVQQADLTMSAKLLRLALIVE
jgi:hypothetical protein